MAEVLILPDSPIHVDGDLTRPLRHISTGIIVNGVGFEYQGRMYYFQRNAEDGEDLPTLLEDARQLNRTFATERRMIGPAVSLGGRRSGPYGIYEWVDQVGAPVTP